MSADGAGAGVIGSEGQNQGFELVVALAGVTVNVAGDEPDGAAEILVGIEDVIDAEFAGGAGHELSETAGAGVADGVGIEIGFDEDDGHNEAGVDAVLDAEGEDAFGDVLGLGAAEAAVAALDEIGVGGKDVEEVGGQFAARGGADVGDVAGHAGRPGSGTAGGWRRGGPSGGGSASGFFGLAVAFSDGGFFFFAGSDHRFGDRGDKGGAEAGEFGFALGVDEESCAGVGGAHPFGDIFGADGDGATVFEGEDDADVSFGADGSSDGGFNFDDAFADKGEEGFAAGGLDDTVLPTHGDVVVERGALRGGGQTGDRQCDSQECGVCLHSPHLQFTPFLL